MLPRRRLDGTQVSGVMRATEIWPGVRQSLRVCVSSQSSVVEDAVAQLGVLPEAELRGASLKCEFSGQPGVDAGGLSRAFFSEFGEGLCTQAVGGNVLFKLTPAQSLVPRSAESLCGHVGVATSDGAVEVPVVPEAILRAYRACGRVSALGLTGGHELGLPFARYFLRLAVAQDFACTLEELWEAMLANPGGATKQPNKTQTQGCYRFICWF